MVKLTHVDERGNARMVDVGKKESTARMAIASAIVRMRPDVVAAIREGAVPKGDVLSAARIAGIQAAKRTHELIPLCHPLRLDSVSVDFTLGDDRVSISATVKATDRTGVEMEALTAVSIAALTIYDMCKAVDRAMTIDNVQLDKKSGGKSGLFVRAEKG